MINAPLAYAAAGVVPSSQFQLNVVRALKSYMSRTKEDLLAHPLAAHLRACDSPAAVFLVLQRQVILHNRHRSSHERLIHYLEPTINVLYTFSLALEGGLGLDVSLATPILTGVGVLILAARDAHASYDIIAYVFKHIVHFFRRLELYSEVSPTNEMKDIIAKMLVEVLSILAVATLEIKRCRMIKWLNRLAGKPESNIEDSLRRLDKLTREEARMSTSQVLKAIILSMNKDANESASEIDDDGTDTDSEVANDEDEMKRSLSLELMSPCDSYTTLYTSEKDDSLPRYTPPPTYGTPEKAVRFSLLLKQTDNKGKTTLDFLWDT